MKTLIYKIKAALIPAQTAVLIEKGQPRKLRGRTNAVLLRELRILCEREKISSALILAYTQDRQRMKLSCSGISGQVQQRLRNTWVSNWK